PGGVERQLAPQQMIPRLDVADEPFGPGRRPLHGATEPPRRPRERHVLRIHLDLRAEAAADVRRDTAHALDRDAQDPREVRRQLVDALKPGVQRVAPGAGVPLSERGARLEKAGDEPVVDQSQARDVRGGRDRARGGLRVAAFPVVGAVLLDAGVQARGAFGERRDGGEHRRPLGVAHPRGVGGIARRGWRGRDDDREGLAGVAHGVRRERVPRRLGERRPVTAPDAAAALGDQGRNGADPVGDEIAPGEHAEHVFEGQRGLRIDGHHVGVGVRRADERRVRLFRRVPVFGVAPLTGQQAKIFAPLDRRADPIDPSWLRHTGQDTLPGSGPLIPKETIMSYDVKVEDIEYLRHGNTPYLATLYRPQPTAMRPLDPRYRAVPLASAPAVAATLRCVIMTSPVIDPLGRYRYEKDVIAKGRPYPVAADELLPCHDAYWKTEEAMAEGAPAGALERGEKVQLPPVLYLQGTDDHAHPRPHLDRFVAAYRN